MESAAGQVPPTGESVAQLLARIERQAALISEGRAREAAKDAVIAVLQARSEAQDAKIGALDQLVSELIAKTGRDSQNSSKPPSSDGPGTRADRRREERERRKTKPAQRPAPGKKKRGGQDGHRGNGLAFSRTPDAKVVLEPGECRGCGGDLASGAPAAAEALQVVDIPGVRALVTEYLLISRRCGCGTVTRAHAPQGAAGAPVCYGPNLTAAALLCHAPAPRAPPRGRGSPRGGSPGAPAPPFPPPPPAPPPRGPRPPPGPPPGPPCRPEIEQIRAAYRERAQAGITANRGRRTSKGDKHPAWVLAQRFHDKIDLILHHLTDFTVPWTSNLAEQALRHAKIRLKISGCFRSLITTRAYCRIHSYLITIRLNAVPPVQAIRDALAGHPWTLALTTA